MKIFIVDIEILSKNEMLSVIALPNEDNLFMKSFKFIDCSISFPDEDNLFIKIVYTKKFLKICFCKNVLLSG